MAKGPTEARAPSNRQRRVSEKENQRHRLYSLSFFLHAILTSNFPKGVDEQEVVERRAHRAQQAHKREALRRLGELRESDDEGREELLGDIDDSSDDDTTFSSRIVASKPSTVKSNLMYRKSKVPAAPVTSQRRGDGNRRLPDSSPERSDLEDSEVRGRSLQRGRNTPSDLTPSPPPSRGIKRGRGDNDSDSDDEATAATAHGQHVAKAQKIHQSQGRPKASDYDDLTQEIVLSAISIYRCEISAVSPYPDHKRETDTAKKAWAKACEKAEVQMDITPELVKMITSRGSHVRGELKTKITPLVEAVYGFESGHNKRIIKGNRERAEDLKEGYNFAYATPGKDVKSRKGLYENPIIQKAVNAMWFANKNDEGVVYTEYFKPFGLVSFALLLTVIECAIDEWATGIKVAIPFTAADYKSIFDAHLTTLNAFKEHSKEHRILDKICDRLHKNGRFHAGAQPIARAAVPAINVTAFDAAIREFEDDGTESDESSF